MVRAGTDVTGARTTKRPRLLIGIACVVLYLVLANLPAPEGLPPAGQKALALMITAIVAWIFEVVPLGISAPLFVMLMPLLGIVSTRDAMANFMIPTVLFVLCSFCFAIVFIDTGLGYRLSLSLSTLFGKRADRVLLAFMLSTCLISTVLADIPTTVVFASIAYPILQKNHCLPGKSNFGRAMMMGIPIAATIGGVGTPAGSGLNVLALGLLKSTANVEVNFLQWTVVGLPFAILLTLISWWVLKQMVPAEIDIVQGLDDLEAERRKLGPLTRKEKTFIVIFSGTLLFWFTGYWTKLDVPTVAMIAATVLFLPGIDLLNWEQAKSRIGWDVLLLVASANTLAIALMNTQAAAWLATSVLGGLLGASALILLSAVIAFGIFSHYIVPVAAAALSVSIPVIAVLAEKTGVNPALLVVPLGYCASCVMLLPLDPVPLATYQYGYWRMPDMMKPGFIISLIWMVLLIVFMVAAQKLGVF